jgi:hypothetical protein
MQAQLTAGFMPCQSRIADKPQMRLEARRGQGLGQPGNAAGNATSLRIGIGTFKGKDVKLHLSVLQRPVSSRHNSLHGSLGLRCAVAYPGQLPYRIVASYTDTRGMVSAWANRSMTVAPAGDRQPAGRWP